MTLYVIPSNHFEDRNVTYDKLRRIDFDVILLEISWLVLFQILANRLLRNRTFLNEQLRAMWFALMNGKRFAFMFGIFDIIVESYMWKPLDYVDNDIPLYGVDAYDVKPDYCRTIDNNVLKYTCKYDNVAIIVGSLHVQHVITLCRKFNIEFEVIR